MWSKLDADWEPLFEGDETKVRCGMSGQQIRPTEEKDQLTYHCFNRGDEDPFEIAFKNKFKEEKWLEAVNKTCPQGNNYIRCMGQNVDQCILHHCKIFFYFDSFILSICMALSILDSLTR